jgi:hypothetical protein
MEESMLPTAWPVLRRGFKPGAGHWMTTGDLPEGYREEGKWLLPPRSTENLAPVFACREKDNQTLSTAVNCDGLPRIEQLGQIFTQSAPGRQALYRCRMGSLRFVSKDAMCEGQTVEGKLGYALPFQAGTPLGAEWSFLDNGVMKIGISLDSGAAIGFFGPSQGHLNYINVKDRGRFLQQSYYGPEQGGSWNGKPWPLNPVQAGDWRNVPSQVLESSNDGQQIHARTRPRDWGGLGLTDAEMEQWIDFVGDMARIRFKFRYDSPAGPSRDQEIPAFFVDSHYAQLVFSTQGQLQFIKPPRLPEAKSYTFEKNWAAFVNDKKEGIGLYNRQAQRLVTYHTDDTSYFAPVMRMSLQPGMIHEYTVYLKAGHLDEIQASFQRLDQEEANRP